MAANSSSSQQPSGLPTDSILIISYLSVVAVTALVGNALLLLVIIKRNLLQKVHYYFILSLAVSDFLNALLKINFTIIGRVDRSWYYPHYKFCYFTTPLGVLFGAASVYSLSAVAVNRYLLISSPLNYMDRMPTWLAKLIVGAIWLSSALLAIPPIIWRKSTEICQSGKVSEEHHLSEILYFVIALWVLIIAIPGIVMSVSYFKIYLIARHHAGQIKSQSAGVNQSQSENKVRRRDVRAAFVLGVIGGIFILCWVPFFIVQTVHKFGGRAIDGKYFAIFLCVMYTNSVLDPILLFLFNAEIRAAFFKVVCQNRYAPVPSRNDNLVSTVSTPVWRHLTSVRFRGQSRARVFLARLG